MSLISSIIMMGSLSAPVSVEKDIHATLDSFHRAASEAKLEPYFAHFANEGVFIGTDAGERWTVSQFKAYAAPHFAKGKGWTYVPRERHVQLAADQSWAAFDELLDNPKYGTARGTGVMRREAQSWKIVQYSLSFPIPNALAASFTDQIQAEEAKAKTKK